MENANDPSRARRQTHCPLHPVADWKDKEQAEGNMHHAVSIGIARENGDGMPICCQAPSTGR